jgi:hypothetical protein
LSISDSDSEYPPGAGRSRGPTRPRCPLGPPEMQAHALGITEAVTESLPGWLRLAALARQALAATAGTQAGKQATAGGTVTVTGKTGKTGVAFQVGTYPGPGIDPGRRAQIHKRRRHATQGACLQTRTAGPLAHRRPARAMQWPGSPGVRSLAPGRETRSVAARPPGQHGRLGANGGACQSQPAKLGGVGSQACIYSCVSGHRLRVEWLASAKGEDSA